MAGGATGNERPGRRCLALKHIRTWRTRRPGVSVTSMHCIRYNILVAEFIYTKGEIQ